MPAALSLATLVQGVIRLYKIQLSMWESAQRKELFNNVICADNSFRLGQPARSEKYLFYFSQPECFRLIGFSVCIVVGLRESEGRKEAE